MHVIFSSDQLLFNYLSKKLTLLYCISRGPRKKCYYTDRHEDKDVKLYLKWYAPNMNELERRMFHFVIISQEHHDELRNCIAEEYRDGFPKGDKLSSGKVLHHIDDASCFEDSVRYPHVLHPLWTDLETVLADKPDWYREKPDRTRWKCVEQHTYETCLCHTGGLVHVGQDESVFGCKSLPSKVWSVLGKTVMSPKSDGGGSMVSSYVSEELGFGANGRTAEELASFNAWRLEKAQRMGLPPPATLLSWPSEIFFDYGKNKGNIQYSYPPFRYNPSHII